MFSGPSEFAGTVDNVMLYIVAISLFFFVGIVITMIYFVIRYNRKRHPKAAQIEGHTALEVTWIVIPTLLALSMFYYSFVGFNTMRKVPKDAMEVKVTGRMWSWQFQYKNGKTSDTLYLPVNKATKLNLTSTDVIHSLYIPAFRVKEDAVAGRKNYLVLRPEKIGSYDIACAEYCGMKHAFMYTKLNIVSEKDFNNWINKKDEISPAKTDSAGAHAQAGTKQ